MFKLGLKFYITISLASFAYATNSNIQKGIDGGIYYTIKDGKTGPYSINTDTLKGGYKYGRVPTENELKAWDKDVMADGTGLPDAKGSVEYGEEVYEAKCLSCHGDFGVGGSGYPALASGNAYSLQKTLTNQRTSPELDGPVRVFGSYWPQASTLWWYIRDGMPHTKSKTLSDEEVYALSAYILYINEMQIDGELVEEDFVLDREKFLKIQMPNKDGFEPVISGKNALENVRAYYSEPKNFGGIKVEKSKRCMQNCQKPTAKIVKIANGGISNFTPPLSSEENQPKSSKTEKGSAKTYESSCAICHKDDSMGAPIAGDKKAWDEKITKIGIDKIYENGIKGINAMPPKGATDISDDEFKKVVDYMITKQ